jgi:VCBS repeat-containing protein
MALRLTADTGSVLENGSATGNVLQNDTSAVRVTQIKAGSGAYVSAASGGVTLPGAYGSLAIMQNGSYVYTASAADRLAMGSKASDTFTYTAVNASGASASTTLKFSVTGINDAPALMSATVTLSSITEDQTVNNGQTISSFLKSSDVDSSAARGIAITGLTSANGQ